MTAAAGGFTLAPTFCTAACHLRVVSVGSSRAGVGDEAACGACHLRTVSVCSSCAVVDGGDTCGTCWGGVAAGFPFAAGLASAPGCVRLSATLTSKAVVLLSDVLRFSATSRWISAAYTQELLCSACHALTKHESEQKTVPHRQYWVERNARLHCFLPQFMQSFR